MDDSKSMSTGQQDTSFSAVSKVGQADREKRCEAELPASQPRGGWDCISPCTAPTCPTAVDSPGGASSKDAYSPGSTASLQPRKESNPLEDISDSELEAAQLVAASCVLKGKEEELKPEAQDIWWEKKSWRERYLYVVNRLRRKVWYASFQQQMRAKAHRNLAFPDRWSDMTPVMKQRFIEFWSLQVGPEVPQKIRDWATSYFLHPEGAASPSKRERTRTKQLLLTYQGPFGDLSWQPGLEATDDIDVAVQRCKDFPYIAKLWETALHRELPAVVKRTNANNWALCMEICKDTLMQGSLRVHLHLCLQRSTVNLNLTDCEALFMFKVEPHMKQERAGTKATQRRSCQLSAMYYVSAPKIGQVFSSASLQPYKQYGVNAEWVWNLLQQDKITIASARQEFIRGKKNLGRHLTNLDVLATELAAQEVEAGIRAKNAELAAGRKQMKNIPEVTAWLRELSATRDRKKFLVLNGPSRLGKTQFAISLFGAEHTLEVNCASADHPPLRAFSPGQHRCVVFDEAPTMMILKNKRLFQSPNCKVIIGLSPTNMNAYPVYLNDAALVICTNTWLHELAAMKEADAAWLKENMVFVDVNAPLWVE